LGVAENRSGKVTLGFRLALKKLVAYLDEVEDAQLVQKKTEPGKGKTESRRRRKNLIISLKKEEEDRDPSLADLAIKRKCLLFFL